jgi:hypothetical protein
MVSAMVSASKITLRKLELDRSEGLKLCQNSLPSLSYLSPISRSCQYRGSGHFTEQTSPSRSFFRVLLDCCVALTCSTCQYCMFNMFILWYCRRIYNDTYDTAIASHNPTTLAHAKLTLVPCGLLIDPLKISVHQIRLTAWPALRIVIDLSILGYHLQICLISLGNSICTLHGTFRWLSRTCTLSMQPDAQAICEKEHKQIIHKPSCPTLVLNPLWSYLDVQCPLD